MPCRREHRALAPAHAPQKPTSEKRKMGSVLPKVSVKTPEEDEASESRHASIACRMVMLTASGSCTCLSCAINPGPTSHISTAR